MLGQDTKTKEDRTGKYITTPNDHVYLTLLLIVIVISFLGN